MSDAKTLEELAFPKYWDDRYSKPDAEESFEWFKSYDKLKGFMEKWLPRPQEDGMWPLILHLGCGNSTLPIDLATLPVPYKNQLCLDFSSIVITQMRTLYSTTLPSIEFLEQDVRHMASVADSSIDVAIDKGTLDAMISGSLWDPPEVVRTNTRLYIDEVARVLKPGGLFLYITYRQPHFVKPAIEREAKWTLEVEKLEDADGGGGFEYFGYVMRKFEKQG